jgi:hypothetical protein
VATDWPIVPAPGDYDDGEFGGIITAATDWPIVPAPGDYDDGEFGGMKIGRGNRSNGRKPASASLCPPKISLDQTQNRTQATAYSTLHLAYYKSFSTNSYHKFLLSSQSYTYHLFQPITPPQQFWNFGKSGNFS